MEHARGFLSNGGQRGPQRQIVRQGVYVFNTALFVVMPGDKAYAIDLGADKDAQDQMRGTIEARDAVEPMLPLSIVGHVSPENAPKPIRQFADVKRLVDQTIDPMVFAYFKDVAQNMTMLQSINDRSKLHEEAKAAMRSRFAADTIDIQEVLIGTPRARPGDNRIENLSDQIRGRQRAAEQQETYGAQRKAAGEQQKLNEAIAAAAWQTPLTGSTIRITVAENQGKAASMRRQQEAQGIRVTAGANACQTVQERDSRTKAVAALGAAEGARWQTRQTIAEILGRAIAKTSQPLVPNVITDSGEGAEGAHSNITMLTASMALTLDRAFSTHVESAPARTPIRPPCEYTAVLCSSRHHRIGDA